MAETERDHREARLQRAEQDLARLAASAQKGRYRQRDRLLQRAMRLLTLLHVDRFFEIEVSRRGRPRLQFRRHTAALAREARKDGVFVRSGSVLDLPADEVVAAYQSLQQVERAFRNLKSFVRLRPVYHRREHRIRAHVFLCVLAYLLEKALERWLATPTEAPTWRHACQVLAPLRWNVLRIGGKEIACCDRPTPEQKRLLDRLGITEALTIRSVRTQV